MKLKIGANYLISHSRKGDFIAKVLNDGDTWITVEIVKGKAHYISISNNLMGRGNIGDVITIRKSFCTFRELESKEKGGTS